MAGEGNGWLGTGSIKKIRVVKNFVDAESGEESVSELGETGLLSVWWIT